MTPNTQNQQLTPLGVPNPTQQQVRPIVPVTPGAGITPQSSTGAPIRRIDALRGERKQTNEGGRTIIREPDRTIIREGNTTIIRHSEVDRFRYGAQDVRVERRGNTNATIVFRPGGERIVTIVDDDGYLIRRSRILADGREIIIIDNRPRGPRTGFGSFIVDLAPPVVRIPREHYIVDTEGADREPHLRHADRAADRGDRASLFARRDPLQRRAARPHAACRPDTVTFDTGSWEISPDQMDRLRFLADSINRAIARNPSEVFLIEGYTDAVGDDVDNLSLSDRRAESVALALTQQFNVPPENLSSQGYGEKFLKVQTDGAERANRRVAARRITPLITGRAQ